MVGACVDADSQFGNSMTPPQWDMNTKLDSSIIPTTYIYSLDSVPSSLLTTEDKDMVNAFNLKSVGSHVDPYTGLTSTQMFSNYSPMWTLPATGDDETKHRKGAGYFGKDPVVDSMSIKLAYSSYVGDTIVGLDIDVYEVVKGNFPMTKLYYSNYNMEDQISEKPILSYRQTGSTSHKAMLPLEFAKKFLRNEDVPTNPYKHDTLFHKEFKGLYIKARATTGQGCVYSLNMGATNMTLYYHNADKDTTTVFYTLYDPSYSAPYNVNFQMAQHDYSRSDISKGGVRAEQVGDSTISTEMGYVQGLAGLGTAVKFSKEQIDEFKAKVKAQGFNNIAINAAELVFRVDNPTADNFDKMFSQLAPYYSLSLLKFAPDYKPFTQLAATSGGVLNRSLGTYTINITSYMQGLMTGRNNKYTFQIDPTILAYLASLRSVVKGSASDTPPQLILTYTMLK